MRAVLVHQQAVIDVPEVERADVLTDRLLPDDEDADVFHAGIAPAPAMLRLL
jgi:hypothetical protein